MPTRIDRRHAEDFEKNLESAGVFAILHADAIARA
jgi:hypothetical protein